MVSTYQLRLDCPKSEQATWGQYWLGPEIGGWRLLEALHTSLQDNPELGPGAGPPQECISLTYGEVDVPPSDGSVQLQVMSLESALAKSAQESTRRFSGSEGDGWKKEEQTVDGREATFYTRCGGEGPNSLEAEVFLPDTYVRLHAWGVTPAQVKQVLSAIRPLQPAVG